MNAKQKKIAQALIKAEEMKSRIATMHSSVKEEVFLKPKKVVAEKNDIDEIGCGHFRLYGRRFDVVKWNEKRKSAVVSVDGEERTMAWPFHKSVYHRAINFEVPQGGYMDMFSNCERHHCLDGAYVVNRYGAWYRDREYIPSGSPFDPAIGSSSEKWIM